jgi:hypothetical protein
MSTTYYASSFIFAIVSLLIVPPLFYIGICEMCTVICYSEEVVVVMIRRRNRKRKMTTIVTETQ